MELNTIHEGDCLELMASMPAACVDLVVTSPPYDGLRTYEGTHDGLDYEAVLRGLYRIIKQGGVVVWVVADQTKDGDESGSSFRQALTAKEVGFRLLDTMIWQKGVRPVGNPQTYWNEFEYMFVLTKGKLCGANLICDRANFYKQNSGGTKRNAKGEKVKTEKFQIGNYGRRSNIWDCPATGGAVAPSGSVAFDHPAIFPERLAGDHILSWSNPGDLVFDPFMGSGTVAVMARRLGRRYVGAELVPAYCEIARQRLEAEPASLDLSGGA